MLTILKKFDLLGLVIALAIVGFDALVWRQIIFAGPPQNTEFIFLDVGQGDSELIMLSGGTKVLTDAGPDAKVVKSLEEVLASGEHYIDLAVITHPQLDHFNGFNYLFDRYEFGAFIINGRDADGIPEWDAFVKKVQEKGIPAVVIREGDKIRYGENEIVILSPDDNWVQSGELNDTSIVELVKTPDAHLLLTGDIGINVEEYLARSGNIRADVIKVPHHGSKYSSGKEFVSAVRPKVAIVEVGKENRFGHPTREALSRLEFAGAKILRTDEDGTVRVIIENKKLKVFTEK